MSAAAPFVGETLTISNGSWNPTPSSYSYQWQSGTTANGPWTNLSNTTNNLTLTSGYVGVFLRCSVTAFNYEGQATVFSSPTEAAVGTAAAPALKIVMQGSTPVLQTSAGSRFIAQGVVEWAIPNGSEDDDAGSGQFADGEWAAINTVVATEQSYGVNIVRAQLGAAYYNSLSTSNQQAYIQKIVTRLSLAKSQNAILMLCCWDALGDAASFATNYTQYDALLQAVCAATNNDSQIVWEPVNEPNGLTFAQWQVSMKHLISVLRTAGYKGVIVCDPINYANSGANGTGFSNTDYAALETYDAGLLGGQHQISFAVHQYWYPSWAGLSPQGSNGAWSLSRFTGTCLGGSTTHNFICTETGYQNGTPQATVELLAWNSAMLTDLATLGNSWSNWGGTILFLQDWVDDNTMFVQPGRTVPTAWGTVAINKILRPVSNPAFSTLTVFDSAHFTLNGTGPSMSGGVITCPVTTAYTGFFSTSSYSLVNSSVSTEISGLAAGTGTRQSSFKLQDAQTLGATQNALGWQWGDNALTPYKTVAGVSTNGTSIAVTGSTFYLKIAEASGIVTWSYSTNGTSWTVAQTATDPFSTTIMGALYIDSANGYYGTETANSVSYSNLNAT